MDKILPQLLNLLPLILAAVGTGLGGFIAIVSTVLGSRWKKAQDRKDAEADLKRAQDDLQIAFMNADKAVKAAEQMIPNADSTTKARLALEIQRNLNAAARINIPGAIQLSSSIVTALNDAKVPPSSVPITIPRVLNEAGVQSLAKELKGEG